MRTGQNGCLNGWLNNLFVVNQWQPTCSEDIRAKPQFIEVFSVDDSSDWSRIKPEEQFCSSNFEPFF